MPTGDVFTARIIFQDTQLDAHFSGLMYAVLSLFFGDPDMHPADFSLLAPACEEEQTEMPDEEEMLMQKATGVAGGVRFGGDGGRDISPSADVVDVSEDDVALMMASAGISGGVRYVPASGSCVIDLSLDAARFDEQMARVRRHFSSLEADARKTASTVEQGLSRQALAAQKAGISVGQYKAAMRTLPAQFTDIVTQLTGHRIPG